MEDYPMWATAIELGIPALLIFALWRIWPKESTTEEVENNTAAEKTNDHDDTPR